MLLPAVVPIPRIRGEHGLHVAIRRGEDDRAYEAFVFEQARRGRRTPDGADARGRAPDVGALFDGVGEARFKFADEGFRPREHLGRVAEERPGVVERRGALRVVDAARPPPLARRRRVGALEDPALEGSLEILDQDLAAAFEAALGLEQLGEHEREVAVRRRRRRHGLGEEGGAAAAAAPRRQARGLGGKGYVRRLGLLLGREGHAHEGLAQAILVVAALVVVAVPDELLARLLRRGEGGCEAVGRHYSIGQPH